MYESTNKEESTEKNEILNSWNNNKDAYFIVIKPFAIDVNKSVATQIPLPSLKFDQPFVGMTARRKSVNYTLPWH